MYDVAMLVFAAIAAIGAVLTVLPLLGFDLRILGRQAMPIEQATIKPKKRVWLALALAVVSLGLSAGAFYYFFRPRIVKNIVEKVVEKPVPIPCPEQKTLEVRPAKPLKQVIPQTSIHSPASQNCPNGICIGGENSGRAAVYNIGVQKPLLLTPDQQSEVAASLVEFKGEAVELDVDNATPETDAFATALKSSLHAAGMNVTRMDAMFSGGCLKYPGVSFMVGVHRTKTAGAIWASLLKVGAVEGRGQGCSRSGEPDELVINIRPN